MLNRCAYILYSNVCLCCIDKIDFIEPRKKKRHDKNRTIKKDKRFHQFINFVSSLIPQQNYATSAPERHVSKKNLLFSVYLRCENENNAKKFGKIKKLNSEMSKTRLKKLLQLKFERKKKRKSSSLCIHFCELALHFLAQKCVTLTISVLSKFLFFSTSTY